MAIEGLSGPGVALGGGRSRRGETVRARLAASVWRERDCRRELEEEVEETRKAELLRRECRGEGKEEESAAWTHLLRERVDVVVMNDLWWRISNEETPNQEGGGRGGENCPGSHHRYT